MKAVIRDNISALAAAALVVAECGAAAIALQPAPRASPPLQPSGIGTSQAFVTRGAIGKIGLLSAYDMPAWTGVPEGGRERRRPDLTKVQHWR
jgi:hypothetical protein